MATSLKWNHNGNTHVCQEEHFRPVTRTTSLNFMRIFVATLFLVLCTYHSFHN